MRERDFADHLSAALAALQREMPVSYARLVAALGGREVELVIDGAPTRVRFRDGSDAPRVRVVCSGQTIVELADAEYTVEDAIWSDRILLFGAVEDLIAFHDALQIFLHGAVRSPSFPRRLEDFRAAREIP